MSNEALEIKVGINVIVMVGCREIEATVLEVREGECLVRSNSSGKIFTTKRILRLINTVEEVSSPTLNETESLSADSVSTSPTTPSRKMSLLNAAVEVLKTSEHPLNTREIVKSAIAQGYWTPTAGKTPEQALYGSIFREIASKENPRIIKSEKKGKFEIAR